MVSISQIISTIAAIVMSLQGVVTNLPVSSQVAQVPSQKNGQVLGASTPELPRANVDISMPSTSSTCTINIASGGNLQSALDQAQRGDTICLQAGATFNGNFILRKKNTGSGWITIRTSTPDNQFVSPGTRVTPSDANKMPKLVTSNSDSVINVERGASHYRLIGLEVASDGIASVVYSIINIGDYNQTSSVGQTSNIVLDRSYVHGLPTQEVRRGVTLSGSNVAVIDSYVSEIHQIGYDTQAIVGWNGSGPYLLENNYLEAAGENVMFGGAPWFADSLIAADVTIKNNHFKKPLSWKSDDPSFAGKAWCVKNLFELKHGRRILIEGNVFENNWSNCQAGWGIVFTVRSDRMPDGSIIVSEISDIIFRNNKLVNSTNGINVLGIDNLSSNTGKMERVLIQNNYLDVKDRPLQLLDGANYVTFTNNTSPVNTDLAAILSCHEYLCANLVFNNNVLRRGNYGLFGSAVGEGTVALDTHSQSYTMSKNIFILNDMANLSYYQSKYPDNYLTDLSGAGFSDFSAKNYSLLSNSTYRNAGTDGKDVGVDWAALNSATQGAVSGIRSGGAPSPAPSNEDATPPTLSSISSQEVNWISALISWDTNEFSSSRVEYGPTTSLGSFVNNITLKKDHNLLLTGLNPGTTYYYKVRSSDSSGNESVSDLKTFKTRDRLNKPPKPQTLNARKGSVILEWSGIEYDLCTNIKIYRSTSNYVLTPNQSNLVATLDCDVTTYRDTSVTPNTYYYSLFTFDDLGAYSEPIFVQFVVDSNGQNTVSTSGSSNTSSSSGRRSTPTNSGSSNPTIPTVVACTPSGFALNRNLAFRSEGEDVKNLQSFLVQKGYTTADNITGFFGPVTIEAIKKFQRDNNIVSSGDYRVTGYGMAGPITRTKINSMMGGVCNNTQSGTGQNDKMIQDQINILYKQVQELLLKLEKLR